MTDKEMKLERFKEENKRADRTDGIFSYGDVSCEQIRQRTRY